MVKNDTLFWTITVVLDIILMSVHVFYLAFRLSNFWMLVSLFAGNFLLCIVPVMVAGTKEWLEVLVVGFINLIILMTVAVGLGDAVLIYALAMGAVVPWFYLLSFFALTILAALFWYSVASK